MSFLISEYAWPAYQGRVPFAHQRVTTQFLLSNKRAFVLNDMGTGKTLSALWASDILISAQKIRRVLIVGPLSTMRSVWYNEVMMNMPHRSITIAHGTKTQRMQAIKSQSDFVVINHDGVKILEDELINEQFDVIIIDELTAYKSNSERSKSMARIASKARAVWGMTGEITPNSPLEAFWQCKVVNPTQKFLPRYYGQFRDACMYKINEMIWAPKPEAPQIVSMCVQPAIRFTREQCLDLPETTYLTVDTPLSPEQSKAYEAMRKQSMIEMSEGSITAVNAAVKMNKLLQISAGSVKGDDGEVVEIGCEPRMAELLNIFYQTPQRKLVVFAIFKSTIAMLQRELTKAGIRCGHINGDVPQNRRAGLIDDFQRGTLEILILQPQSSAHGITLTAASTIVWFSLVPSNELFNQGNARIVRAGQLLKTFIFMLVSTTAERRVANILRGKEDISHSILSLFNDQSI